jgi:beta-glucanase (GH16 family)
MTSCLPNQLFMGCFPVKIAFLWLMASGIHAAPVSPATTPVVVTESASPAFWAGSGTATSEPPSPTSPFMSDAAPTRQWSLRWHDEFSGHALDRSLWDYRVDAKFGSVQLPENVSVEGDRLILTLRAQESRGKHYTGAGVVSRQRFLHGYYEARIRFPEASGWWSVFWLMKNSAGGRANEGARDARQEIDIIEHASGFKPKDGYQVNIHWWKGGHFVIGPSKVRVPFPLSGDFHVYGFDYLPGRGVFYLDGKKVAEVDLSTLPEQEPANIWLTSIQGMANGVETTKLPTRMEVDYVRFFEPK